MLKAELEKSGYRVSERTVRRTLHRLRLPLEAPEVRASWQARSRLRAEKGEVVVRRAREVLEAGGEVWFGDETSLREFPPLKCAWSRRGEQAEVIISGRNARRTVVGFLNVVRGKLVREVRRRSRGEDIAAGVEALGRAKVRRLLVWENAPPHQARIARGTAETLSIEIAKLCRFVRRISTRSKICGVR
jgi:hypothetical protein